jgi:hypothetical protein
MLKQIANIVLVMVMLVSFTGVTFYKHYCSGSLITKSIEIPPQKCCGDDCKGCHNEAKTYKVTDNFEAGSSIQNFKAEVKQLFLSVSFAFVFFYNTIDFSLLINPQISFTICNKNPLTAKSVSALLQVFRL